MRQKVTVGLAAIAVFTILIAILPRSTWNRLTTFSESQEAAGEAVESSEARQYLLKQSIIYTLQKPFFGVGPGQFSLYEGQSRVSEGLKGDRHETHNSYTQNFERVRHSCLCFDLAAMTATFGLLRKIRKKAREFHQGRNHHSHVLSNNWTRRIQHSRTLRQFRLSILFTYGLRLGGRYLVCRSPRPSKASARSGDLQTRRQCATRSDWHLSSRQHLDGIHRGNRPRPRSLQSSRKR